MQHCPNCGGAAPADAAHCPRCGAALSPNAPRTGAPGQPPPSGGGTGKTVMWVAVGCGCLFVGVIVLGILAAIAIPRFASVSKQAKEAEAQPVLRQLVLLQRVHRDAHGRYTENLGDPDAADYLSGWADPYARYYVFWVTEATENDLCVLADVSGEGEASELSTFSMDESGTLYRGPDCQPGTEADAAALPELPEELPELPADAAPAPETEAPPPAKPSAKTPAPGKG